MRSRLLLSILALAVAQIGVQGVEPLLTPAKADAQALDDQRAETQRLEKRVAELQRQLSTMQNELQDIQTKLAALGEPKAATPPQPAPGAEEVTIEVEPALEHELLALDALRAGTSTNFEKVDVIGQELLRRFTKPRQQGQIYSMLLQVHGQSGLVTPERIIEYAQKALKFPLGSVQRSMVYIYWGDTLNVTHSADPWPTQRRRAAEAYLQGAEDLLQYHLPESQAEFTEIPPPIIDAPGDEPALRAREVAWRRYQKLRQRYEFIRQMIYQRDIFVRQIAEMYGRRGATDAEITDLQRRARETLANDTEVARLMNAVRIAVQPKPK